MYNNTLLNVTRRSWFALILGFDWHTGWNTNVEPCTENRGLSGVQAFLESEWSHHKSAHLTPAQVTWASLQVFGLEEADHVNLRSVGHHWSSDQKSRDTGRISDHFRSRFDIRSNLKSCVRLQLVFERRQKRLTCFSARKQTSPLHSTLRPKVLVGDFESTWMFSRWWQKLRLCNYWPGARQWGHRAPRDMYERWLDDRRWWQDLCSNKAVEDSVSQHLGWGLRPLVKAENLHLSFSSSNEVAADWMDPLTLKG